MMKYSEDEFRFVSLGRYPSPVVAQINVEVGDLSAILWLVKPLV